jgi:hypothetical protein
MGDNFSTEVIGAKLEKVIDNMPYVSDDADLKNNLYNEFYKMKEGLSDKEFVIDIYKNILNDSVDENTEGFKKWIKDLSEGSINQYKLYHHFIEIAKTENLKKPKVFSDLLSEDDEGKRIAIIMPSSATDLLLINSLIANLQKKHRKHNIYVFTQPQFFECIEDNPHVYKCIPYSESVDNPILMEGFGENKGFFEAAYYPSATTQNLPCYIHNGK